MIRFAVRFFIFCVLVGLGFFILNKGCNSGSSQQAYQPVAETKQPEQIKKEETEEERKEREKRKTKERISSEIKKLRDNCKKGYEILSTKQTGIWGEKEAAYTGQYSYLEYEFQNMRATMGLDEVTVERKGYDKMFFSCKNRKPCIAVWSWDNDKTDDGGHIKALRKKYADPALDLNGEDFYIDTLTTINIVEDDKAKDEVIAILKKLQKNYTKISELGDSIRLLDFNSFLE